MQESLQLVCLKGHQFRDNLLISSEWLENWNILIKVDFFG